MDWPEILTSAGAIIAALGGLEAIKFFFNRKTESKVNDAKAFEVQREALMEDYKRVQQEVDKLNEKVNQLYEKVHALENERLDLLKRNNELEIALKEAEKKECLQPDDRYLQRLRRDDRCRLRKLLRDGYNIDHPDAIVTEEDMLKEPNKQEE